MSEVTWTEDVPEEIDDDEAGGVIVVVDGKHLAHPWARAYGAGIGGGLKVYEDDGDDATADITYGRFDYVYFGQTMDDKPEVVELKKPVAQAQIASPRSARTSPGMGRPGF